MRRARAGRTPPFIPDVPPDGASGGYTIATYTKILLAGMQMNQQSRN